MTIQKRVINEAFFEFKFLKDFLERVAGSGSYQQRKQDKADELGLDLSKSGKVKPEELRKIAKDELEKIYKDFGVDEREVFSIFKGESNFDTRAFNASGAVGLFQVIPKTAKDLGTTVKKIHDMSAKEQVSLYHSYLSMYKRYGNLKGRLGILQAAPAKAGKKMNEPIYDKGSKAWEQNPGWRTSNDGPITIASISDYYARKA